MMGTLGGTHHIMIIPRRLCFGNIVGFIDMDKSCFFWYNLRVYE